MGCSNTKPAEAPKPVATDTTAPKEPQGTPFVTKKKHHADPSIMMCSYFQVTPNEFNAFKTKADAFYKAAKETDDLLFYGMSFCDGGVLIRQGYRGGGALIEHLRKADKPMTDALNHGKLEKVEVHGPRRQLSKVKKVMTKIGDCYFSFFECSKSMKPCRAPTEYKGTTDNLVSCTISIKVTKIEWTKIANKLYAVHERARLNPFNESCLVSYCVKEGTCMLSGFFENMESTMEHVACSVSHLGHDLIHNLQLHGPDKEMAKVKALISKAQDGFESAASVVKASVEASCARAKEEAKQAKACAAAAAKAVACGVNDKLKAGMKTTCAAIDEVQAIAEELAKECYQNMVKVEGCSEDVAKAVSKAAYKKAMGCVSEVWQSCSHASKTTYHKACSAGIAFETALERLNEAAQSAAKECHDGVVEDCEAAQAELERAEEYVKQCALESKEEAEKALQECKAELYACKLAVKCTFKAVEHACSDSAKEVRKEACCMWTSVKKMAEEVVHECYKEDKRAEQISKEALDMVSQKAMGACWSITCSAENVFYLAYEHAVSCKKSIEDATNAAVSAAETAGTKACNLWKGTEKEAIDGCKQAEAMVKQSEKAVERVWTKTTTYIVKEETTIRYSLYKKEVEITQEITEVTYEMEHFVCTCVEEVEDTYEAAQFGIMARISDWYRAILEAEMKALRAVADAADSKADKVQTSLNNYEGSSTKKKKICC